MLTIPSAPQAGVLSAAERATLQRVCETLLPALAPEPGDDPALFRLSAATQGVPEALEQALAALDPVQQAQFRLLLRMLERPAVLAVLSGRPLALSRLDSAARERALLALATSPLPPLRTGFQGLKRLATFLFYSVVDDRGANRAWPTFGYVPAAHPPASAPVLDIQTLAAPTTLECDACVIGSGAGGGVVAAELAATGKRVVVLEAGSGQQAPDFDQRELAGMRGLYLDQGMTATRDLGVAILAGATLGGGTTVNWQTSLPLPPAIRDEWAERSGCAHFAAASFTRSLDAVMRRINAHITPEAVNRNNDVLRRGADALGYRCAELPRNDSGCDPALCGSCVFGCRTGGKQSTAVTFLCDAQQGATEIVAYCRADRLIVEQGKVAGVAATATDPATGRAVPVVVRAPVVVVAAGALQSPALLLRSGIRLPELGRNLFLHPTSAISGTYRERVEPWVGPGQSVLCDEFAYRSGTYGYRLETAPGHPGLMALATPWFGARQHRREMQQLAHKAVIIVLTRDRAGGRVSLGRGGRPVIDYRPGRAERGHLQHGIAQAVRLHLAAGAHDVLTLHARSRRSPADVDAIAQELGRRAVDRNWSTLFSAHQMGTCRMGRDARTAVCDADGEVFGVRGLFIADGSAFPASSGVNPMVTIMALAHHTAQAINAR